MIANINDTEKKLLKLIKIVPIVTLILFSVIITYVILNDSIQRHKQNLILMKTTYISKQKDIIKSEVLRVVRQIKYQKSIAETKLKQQLSSKTRNVYDIVINIYNENKTKDSKTIIKMIKDAIRPIRFNKGRGYFFIYKMDGTNVLLPPLPKYEGKNLWNLRDKKGLYTIRELSKIAKEKKEGFLSWYWYKPNDNKTMYKKIGFVKYIEPLDLFIGTGEYIKDFEEGIKQDLIKEIRQIRYGKNGYIFVHQYDGLCLSHINKKMIGKYRLDDKSGGEYIIRKIISIAKKGDGFIEYFGTIMPSTGLPARKISYVYGFDDWQWQIGSGAYLNDIDLKLTAMKKDFKEKFNQTIKKVVMINILITFLLILILYFFSKDIEKRFNIYKKLLEDKNKESIKKDKLIFEQSKLASMGEMIGNIAHQWRQPLSVISMAASGMLIQKEHGLLTDEIFKNNCEQIEQNAQYLSKTIDDFKNYIKGDRTKKVFNLKDEIDSFLHLINSSIKTHNINTIVDIEDDIQINGYQNELTQCFINIFNNAKDALKDNNIEHRLIFISTKVVDDKVMIVFKDNAGGIPQKIINKIFEPYFTTKHQSQGTGLGLHMTYKLIVDGMGGTIEADNTTYKYEGVEYTGAQFTIVLDR